MMAMGQILDSSKSINRCSMAVQRSLLNPCGASTNENRGVWMLNIGYI